MPDMGQHQMLLSAGDCNEERRYRCSGITPKELLLDPEHNDLLELKALTLVDGQEPDGVHLRKAPECLGSIPANGKLPVECVKRLLDHIVEPGALLVPG